MNALGLALRETILPRRSIPSFNPHWAQQTSRYWPNTGPIPLAVLAQYRKPVPARYGFAHRICIGPVPFYSIGPVLGRYRASTDLFVLAQYWTNTAYPVLVQYRTGTGPILELFFGIGPVQARYRASTDLFVLAQYWTNTAYPVLVQYRIGTGPILEQFFGIGPVQARYRASTDLIVLAQYRPNTGLILGQQYCLQKIRKTITITYQYYQFSSIGPVQIQYPADYLHSET